MAAGSMAKASQHEPVGKPGGPGLWKHKGWQLPAYIQHIANDLMEKRGKSESNAIQIAIGVVKRWAKGIGNVTASTRAAAAKAVAEWEKLKGQAKGAKAGKKISEAAMLDFLALELDMDSEDVEAIVEAAYTLEPPEPEGRVLSMRLSDFGISEAKLTMASRKKIDKSNFAIPEKAPGPGSYPIHDLEHARKALQLSGGKPEESRVRAAVHRKHPALKKRAKAAA